MPRIRSLIIGRKSPFGLLVVIVSIINAYGYLNQAGLMFHGDFAGNPVYSLPFILSKKPYRNRYDKSTNPMNCTVRRTSYTMGGGGLLYLLLILLMRSGDVETNPGPNTAESTVGEEELWTLAHEGTRLYPTVLWYVLADYIRPEDITTFSCICKATYSITRTVSFWKKLYYRYHKHSTALPPYLRPEQIPRTGLRTFVIRALYFLYKPYRLALNTTSPVGEGLSSPEAVTGFTCLSLRYHGMYSQHFTYFLKLGLESREGVSCYPNIFANDDRGKCILRIRCIHFQNVPLAEIVIMRLQLVRSSVSVGADMFTHRVKLEFGRKDLRGLYVKSSIITVILDPVLKVDVLHWWHPLFM